MHLLVVGAGGLIGSNVLAEGKARGWDVIGTFHNERPAVDVPLEQLDVRDDSAVHSIVSSTAPDLVINCAAITNVDGCERDFRDALAVNSVAPGRLAAACDDQCVDFVHLSTDYVFDGKARRPYTENDDPRPIQRYGATKYLGELKVRTAHASAVIARLSFVYGTRGDDGKMTGFPAWVHSQLKTAGSVSLFTDQYVTPTRAGAAANTVCDLGMKATGEVFHVASRSCATPYEFGRRLCEWWEEEPERLKRGSYESIDRPATRPHYSCLNVGKVEAALDRPQPTIGEDIAEIATETVRS